MMNFPATQRRVMKTILIPTEDHDAMPTVLEAALLVARAFDSYMEGFAARLSAGTYVTVEPVSSLAMSSPSDEDRTREVQALFENFMQKRGVLCARASPSICSYGWPRNEAADDAFLGSYGRVFDLIVIGRPGREPENPRMAALEAALFESGKPVLVVPKMATPPRTIGRNILIAWNGSTEQAHAHAFAMPILRQAERVTVLTVEGGTTPGPSGELATLHLVRNGINANALTVASGALTTGEVILEQAASSGCDLLVKGAYTQSRLRQMMFGGATRHILANAALPVLMAH
jgi:nucleotide-binding universal stress UspA family protein